MSIEQIAKQELSLHIEMSSIEMSKTHIHDMIKVIVDGYDCIHRVSNQREFNRIDCKEVNPIFWRVSKQMINRYFFFQVIIVEHIKFKTSHMNEQCIEIKATKLILLVCTAFE